MNSPAFLGFCFHGQSQLNGELVVRNKSWLIQLSQTFQRFHASRLRVSVRRRREPVGINTPARIEFLEPRYLLSAAATVGFETRVNSTTSSDQANSAVASDPAGDTVIVWQSPDQDGSGFGVYAQRYNAAGVVLGSEFRVNTYTTGVQD